MTIGAARREPAVAADAKPDKRVVTLFPRRKRLRASMIFGVLSALAGVILTLVILPPPIYGDSYQVWRAAELWPDLANYQPLHHAMRLGTVLPTRVAQEVLGDGHISLIVASAFLAALLTAGTYAAGRALFGNAVGLLAVGLLVIHPFFTVVDPYTREVTHSTGNLMPDMPAAGLFAGGVAALVIGSRRAGRTQTLWLVTAGMSFGLAYLTREFVAFMFVAIPVFAVLLRLPLSRLAVLAIPMAAVAAAELVHNAIVYGDPLARLSVAAEHHAPRDKPISRLGVLLRFLDLTTSRPLAALFLAGLLLTIAGLVMTKDRRFGLVLVWFFSLWLPLTVLGGLIDPMDPSLPPQNARYWIPVLPPLLIGGLGALVVLARRLPRRPWAAALALAVGAVTAVLYVGPALAEIPKVHRDEDWNELRGWLARHPDVGVIYTDIRTSQTASFYTRTPTGKAVWDGEFKTFDQRIPALPAEVGDHPYLESNFGALAEPSPEQGWRVIWTSSNEVLAIWSR